MSPTRQHPQPSQPAAPLTTEERRAEALRRAARAKREAAITRAEGAIRELVKTRQEITFRSVARAGPVSLDFLYANTELRRRIETLRAQQATHAPNGGDTLVSDDVQGSVAQILTVKLREERAARRTAISDLEQRLAAAHGELLRLRRILEQHGIQP